MDSEQLHSVESDMDAPLISRSAERDQDSNIVFILGVIASDKFLTMELIIRRLTRGFVPIYRAECGEKLYDKKSVS